MSAKLDGNISKHNQALFETTKRLLAEVVNEGLVDATIGGSKYDQFLYLNSRLHAAGENDRKWVKVSLQPGTVLETRDGKVACVVRPDSLQPPVVIGNGDAEEEELDPGVLFKNLSPWLVEDADEEILNEIALELGNSARNQDWERALIYGHPSHPYHRLCYAQPPLNQIQPSDIPEMLTPTLAFLSVPRTDLRVTGAFEEIIQPLLRKLEIPSTTPDRVIVPCLSRQLPAVDQRFPNAVVLKTVENIADAQASMRTLTLRPESDFGYHLKLSLACQITSALRTITPWTTCGGPVQTALLERFLPNDLWVFREVAAVSGGQDNFADAKHLSCILRDDLEARADANNERLVIAAALAQQPYNNTRCYAEILYNLRTTSDKQSWLRTYATRLFSLVLPPLARYGIGLEAHGQNLVARICRKTGEVKGFAVRDFGGVRMHVPTLENFGVNFDGLPPGGATLTEDLHNVWSKVHHALVQNHVGLIVSALRLERDGGWGIVREVLGGVLEGETSGKGMGREVGEYFLQDTMPFKCFLRMRMEGKYRDYVEREVPNVLLMDSPRWEEVLRTYQPTLHYT
ncbi:uncharacterized protein EURHEDRAFT_513335 [Aspergillus ruber CBS 135680]|uniref:IucC family-domain-containing protein n=1 Tax=Aspergillus ruber (strain CBS 135680) TaxID=1388766 RepID=A0A017SLC0_ASPRC|nr:uncharacterized protein EURHEDRAFT_513335 [Aspergillus ruber CBS 135680]EYE97444.1 hypothetical protein EURHEDRAFT_513335 [Aspergillus ruber CBS 135680]